VKNQWFRQFPNKNLYNGGSEWQNDTKAVNAGVPDYYQTFYRNYDPALARFVSVDPEAEGAESMSDYHYAGDNPIVYNDVMGDLANVKINQPVLQGGFNDPALGDAGDANYGGGGGGGYVDLADAIGRNSDPNWMNDGAFDDAGAFSDDHGAAGIAFWNPPQNHSSSDDDNIIATNNANSVGANPYALSDGDDPGTRTETKATIPDDNVFEDPDAYFWGWNKDFRSLFPSIATNILWTQLGSQQRRFPSFNSLWENYPCTNRQGQHSFILSQSLYENQCAVRLGYALIQSGANLQNYNGAVDPSTGYPLRATELASWVQTQLGAPMVFSFDDFVNYTESHAVQGIIYEMPMGGPAHIDLIYNGNLNFLPALVGEQFYQTTTIEYWPVK